MAKPKVIVDRVRSVTRAEQLVGGSPQPKGRTLAVVLLTKSTVMLDVQPPKGAAWERILKEFQRLDKPVYLAVDPSTNLIVDVNRPRSVFILKVAANLEEKKGYRVDLEISPAVHYVESGNEDRQSLLKSLRSALDTRTRMLVTIGLRRGEIIDVRPDPRPPAKELAKKREPRSRPLARIAPVSPAEALRLFDFLKSQVHIPFAFPEGGCWVRAHEMVRLMDPTVVPVKKLWLYAPYPSILEPPTKHHPDCKVPWAWHVAPTVEVNDGTSVTTHVIDPSLFDRPVPQLDWFLTQNNLTAVQEDSNPMDFMRGMGGLFTEADDDYSKTTALLDEIRLELAIREAAYPPPYPCP